MKPIPTSSQTIGPFFRIGLEYLRDRLPDVCSGTEEQIEIRGVVLDRDGVPVPDALLEFWSGGRISEHSRSLIGPEITGEFRRIATNEDGQFSASMQRPTAIRSEDGEVRAPHFIVLVFARGLLRHLLTHVYFECDLDGKDDPALMYVPVERRNTLIARPTTHNSYVWNVRLQGPNETVFFAW